MESENTNLKERLLELEYRQTRNNLLFEGLAESENESEYDCIMKIRRLLKCIPGLDSNFRVDRCHRIDGPYKPCAAKPRRIICVFNWFVDVQFILQNRKQLPKGVYVNEDLPDEWLDRRKILRPIYNAAKRRDLLKGKTHMSKDKLIIGDETISAAPICNIDTISKLGLDATATCEHADNEKRVFLGSLSPFSNLHKSSK